MAVTMEIYARPAGAVYACGSFSHPSFQFEMLIEKENTDEGDTLISLPKSSDLVVCVENRCQGIIDYVSSIFIPIREGQVLEKQACYLPSVSQGGDPLIE